MFYFRARKEYRTPSIQKNVQTVLTEKETDGEARKMESVLREVENLKEKLRE